jgi:N utilization substance protein A
VAREAGSRTKLGVSSKDRDVDPVGACVGMKGSRVQAVVQELRGEKIDIIAYDPDPARYVVNALAPAEISRVVVDEVNSSMEVIVADDMLSLAIGRRGQNVRLASKLTGWRIDVKSESKYGEALRDGYRSLLDVVGVGEVRADVLFQAGYGSAEALADADPADLAALPDISEERAAELIADARRYLAEGASAEQIEQTETEVAAKEKGEADSAETAPDSAGASAESEATETAEDTPEEEQAQEAEAEAQEAGVEEAPETAEPEKTEQEQEPKEGE